jgi:hypothetical protein
MSYRHGQNRAMNYGLTVADTSGAPSPQLHAQQTREVIRKASFGEECADGFAYKLPQVGWRRLQLVNNG